jgi:hypothetical protein
MTAKPSPAPDPRAQDICGHFHHQVAEDGSLEGRDYDIALVDGPWEPCHIEDRLA